MKKMIRKMCLRILNMKVFNYLPDKIYLKIKYLCKIGKILDLKNPQTYNEKLQWLKLNDRNPIYTNLVDKYEVKKYISEKIGDEYIIPTLGIYNNFDEINFDSLPDQFVIKCTHDSGGVVICKNKHKFNKKNAKNKIEKSLKKNYFYNGREWPYKNIKPRIIIEEYMKDENDELNDYKFFVFHGNVKALFIATDRNAETETCFDFFDENFNHLPFLNGHPNANKKFEKPKMFEKMIELAEYVAKDFIHARVDFYNINGKIYFGEITFYHWSGMVEFQPEEWDKKFGDFINLPQK